MLVNHSRIFLILTISLFTFLFQVSCEKNIINNYQIEEKATKGTVVSNDLTEIATFYEVSQFSKGTSMKIRLNRNGTEIIEYPVQFDAIYEFENERLIFCRTPEDIRIGGGDSGSPLITEEGKIAGVLCYGFNDSNHQFAARAIEDLLAIESLTKPLILQRGNTLSYLRPILPAYIVSGFQNEFIQRYFNNNEFKFPSNYCVLTQNYMPTGGLCKQTIYEGDNLYPGNSIIFFEISGDIINTYLIATATYLNENKIYGVGHECYLNPLAAPTYLAKMITFIEADWLSSKIAVPTGNTIGSLIMDTPAGVLIDIETEPKEFAVKSTITLNEEEPKTYNHTVSSLKDISREQYLSSYISASLVYDVIKYSYLDFATAKGTITVTLDSTVFDTTFEFYSDDPYSYDGIDWKIYSFINDFLENHPRLNISEFNMNVQIYGE